MDATLQLYRRAREFPNVGFVFKLFTSHQNDLASLLLPRARFVCKIIQRAGDCVPRKSLVDENYFLLAKERLLAKKAEPNIRAAFGTHDILLLRHISEFAAASGLPKTSVEVQMLYGIQSGEQERLARDGYRSKVLVSYGSMVYLVYGDWRNGRPICGLWREIFSFPVKIYVP